jgi:hypothetical protein
MSGAQTLQASGTATRRSGSASNVWRLDVRVIGWSHPPLWQCLECLALRCWSHGVQPPAGPRVPRMSGLQTLESTLQQTAFKQPTETGGETPLTPAKTPPGQPARTQALHARTVRLARIVVRRVERRPSSAAGLAASRAGNLLPIAETFSCNHRSVAYPGFGSDSQGRPGEKWQSTDNRQPTTSRLLADGPPHRLVTHPAGCAGVLRTFTSNFHWCLAYQKETCETNGFLSGLSILVSNSG